jgi:hypothetical protein
MFNTLSRLRRTDWLAIAFVAALALGFLPIAYRKTVWFGQGDVQVLFRAGWAVWTGYPLYQVFDDHGWTYHYPPTLALFMAPFANPIPGHPQPAWALPYAASVVIWYLLNTLCLILSVHIWAGALERFQPRQALTGPLRGPSLLRLGPVLALLPFVGDGLGRGQVTPMLLLLIVAFFVLYVENRAASAALALAIAITIKLFPLALGIVPALRRDWRFMFWAAAWCGVLLIALPIICVGPSETLDLYRAMWTKHLSGIISGSMSHKIASEVSPGAYSNVSVGALVARIVAGEAFYQDPLPVWANALQYLFDAIVIAAVAFLGRGGFWNMRGVQPTKGYPLLVAGAVLSAAIPLMISAAKPNYVTFALPLMAVLMLETWQRAGRQVVTGTMIGWTIMAWLSMISLEVRWNWLKLVGLMTWALLLLAPASLRLIRTVSVMPGDASPGSRVA